MYEVTTEQSTQKFNKKQNVEENKKLSLPSTSMSKFLGMFCILGSDMDTRPVAVWNCVTPWTRFIDRRLL